MKLNLCGMIEKIENPVSDLIKTCYGKFLLVIC